jgi:DNA modification methylase
VLYLGGALHILKKLEDNTVDSCVVDPPYGLSFMGKGWDYDVPSIEIWKECLRVLKPGGHLLAFGGTRTYHRLVVNIEDAGFEIRDQIQWLYGSGFPKSMDIAKQIDKQNGFDGEIIGTAKGAGKNDEGYKSGSGGLLKSDYEIKELSDEAKKWSGWGTALKPANEPICLARKPLSESTVAKNVLRWGTGGLNIDDTRIEGQKRSPEFKNPKSELGYHGGSANSNLVDWDASKGRFPANIILDETAAQMLDEQTKDQRASKPSKTGTRFKATGAFPIENDDLTKYDDSGGASRFFYCAKASKSERNANVEGANNHPTVKPIKLMEYLIKLVTPENGTVLDCFMGSGTTGVAAKNLGFNFIGIELDENYFKIAEKRINKCPIIKRNEEYETSTEVGL